MIPHFENKDTSGFLSGSQISAYPWLGQILSSVKVLDVYNIERKVFCFSTHAVSLLSTHFAHMFSHQLSLSVKNNVSNETSGDQLLLV